jgi:hypothetical protein
MTQNYIIRDVLFSKRVAFLGLQRRIFVKQTFTEE